MAGTAVALSGTQTISGAKTFSSQIIANGGIITNNQQISTGTGNITGVLVPNNSNGSINGSTNIIIYNSVGSHNFNINTGTGSITCNNLNCLSLTLSGAFNPSTITASGLITANGGLTVTGTTTMNNNITLNSTISPSAGQLGYMLNSTYYSGVVTSATWTTFLSFTLGPGSWIISCNPKWLSTVSGTSSIIAFGFTTSASGTPGYNNYYIASTVNIGANISNGISFTFTYANVLTTTQTYYIRGNITHTVGASLTIDPSYTFGTAVKVG